MFQWDEKRQQLAIPARQVLRLERSLSDVQVSLPGLDPQLTTAYLCAFQVSGGLRVAIVLHLHTSRRLAFYLNREGTIDKEDAGRVLGEAVHFAETLGFMLGDLDFLRIPEQDRERYWQSLPLAKGIPLQPAGATVAGEKQNAETDAPEPPVRNGWTVEEMTAKRRKFIENLGRLMGML